jgi:serpin B
MRKVTTALGSLLLAGAAALLLSCPPPATPSTLDEIDARALPYASTPEKDAVVESINAFAIDLYGKLAEGNEENFFFSPFSISTALAMTYAGAQGTTETQMASTLHFSLPQTTLHPAFGALLADMEAVGARDGYELSTANSLWGQIDLPFVPEFLATLASAYGAPLREVDFQTTPEPSRQTINAWVASATHDRIKDLLPQGSINDLTRLVLANAIYFKGSWARTFDAADTRSGDFHPRGGGTIQVPMMHQTAQFRYAWIAGTVQVLELPYTTGDLSMIFIMADTPDGMPDLETALSLPAFEQWCDALVPANELSVNIPSVTFASTFRLAQTLGALGMTEAFDPSLADFSGIADQAGLFIGDVFHKSFVLVNEEGTEAAAATGVTTGVTSMPPSFYADHPFIFLIRHNRSGAILFLGRVMDPRP